MGGFGLSSLSCMGRNRQFGRKDSTVFTEIEGKLVELVRTNMVLVQAQAAYGRAVEGILADPNPYAPDIACDIRAVREGQSVVVIGLSMKSIVERVTFNGLLTISERGDVLAFDTDGETHSLMRMGIVPYHFGWGRHIVSVLNDPGSLGAALDWLRSQDREIARETGMLLEEYIEEEFPGPKGGWAIDD